jgi:hypothetical protein
MTEFQLQLVDWLMITFLASAVVMAVTAVGAWRYWLIKYR